MTSTRAAAERSGSASGSPRVAKARDRAAPVPSSISISRPGAPSRAVSPTEAARASRESVPDAEGRSSRKRTITSPGTNSPEASTSSAPGAPALAEPAWPSVST